MPIQPQESITLVEKLFDDRLSDDELQRLNHVLRRSPEAREHYWHLVMLEGYLADLPGWIAGQQYATQLAFSETLEAFIEIEANAQATLQTYPPASDATDEKEQITWQDVRRAGAFCIRSLARQKATWGVAAAAMVCILALVYATWFGGSPSQPPSTPIADLHQPSPPFTPPAVEPLPVEPPPVAVVLHQHKGAEIASENVIPPGTELAQGHIIELQADNAIHLKYRSGAQVILQGPGAFELLSPERVGMEHGRITAVVPPQAKGFTVSTAQTDFIDHGTEFGVTLDEAGHGEVIVLDGLIEARQATTDTPQAHEPAQGMMLREGVGGRLAPDEVLPQSVQSIDQFEVDQYARNWDDVVYRPQISGQITYTSRPPASLVKGHAISTNPLLIPERRGVVLPEDLYLNANKANKSVIRKRGEEIDPKQDYVIAAGTELNSFLIHYDTVQNGAQEVVEREFKIQFRGRIVAIVEINKYQLKTDELFGLASMQYPVEGSLRGASDPPGHPNFDVIRVSNDLRTLTVKMRLTGLDQIRVLVENSDS